jgi:hypothetical protein
MPENQVMPNVSEPALADLRAELRSFKEASGAKWAYAAAQLAGAVEALLDEAEPD